MWEKLEKVNIKNKEKYLKLFKELINQIKSNKYDFKDIGKEDLINEKDIFENTKEKELKAIEMVSNLKK